VVPVGVSVSFTKQLTGNNSLSVVVIEESNTGRIVEGIMDPLDDFLSSLLSFFSEVFALKTVVNWLEEEKSETTTEEIDEDG
jgi:hypothetical protein